MRAKDIEIGAVYETDWQKVRVLKAATQQKGWWLCETVEDHDIWGQKGTQSWHASVALKRRATDDEMHRILTEPNTLSEWEMSDDD